MYSPVIARKVELLLKLMPFVMNESVFAVHGGTAINLFIKDMPRYSVDIDLTYMPLASREESINDINNHLIILPNSKNLISINFNQKWIVSVSASLKKQFV